MLFGKNVQSQNTNHIKFDARNYPQCLRLNKI